MAERDRLKKPVAKPVFIMSSERSGSNLLRTPLANHSKICGPRAPHLLKTFSDLIPYYGSLSASGYGERLLKDVLRVVNHPHHDWGLEVSFEQIHTEYNPKTFMEYFDATYSAYSEKVGADRIVCKENEIFDYACELSNYYGTGGFIYLHRDPRDCAASWMNVPLGYDDPVSVARLWKREQNACTLLRQTFDLPVIPVQYGELISDPESEMTRVLKAIGEEVEPACFSTADPSDEVRADDEYRKNLDQPIMSSNSKKYREQFDEETVWRIESIVKEPMMRLGYKFETDADWDGPGPRSFSERVFSVLGRAWKYLAPELNSGTGEEEISEHADDTARVLASRMELREELYTKRRQEWYSRNKE